MKKPPLRRLQLSPKTRLLATRLPFLFAVFLGNPPLKFLYSHRTKSADGQYVHIRELTDALQRDGQMIMLSGPEGSFLKQDETTRALDAIEGESKGLLQYLPRFAYELAEFAYTIPSYFRLTKAEQAISPDIIYERYSLFYFAGLWLKKKTGLPLIVEVNSPLRRERTEHGGLSLKRLAAWTERKVWRGADALLPVTQVLAEDLLAIGIAPEKITVIPNGVTERWLAPVDALPIIKKHQLEGKLVLGFTGFVRDWHGVDKVLDYMANNPERRLHLLLVGDGPAVPDLKAQATRLGLADSFTVTGVVQREDVAKHVAAFDIALQPRVTEYASPLKLMEYMALSRPILAPDMANIREVLVDGENALLFNANDDVAMGRTLDRLVHDQTLCETLGKAARQTVLDREMTWDGNARKVAEIAAQLIAKNS